MLSLFDKKGAFKLCIPELIAEEDLTGNKLGDLKGDFILIEAEEDNLAAGIAIY
jgi:hypothetical protein